MPPDIPGGAANADLPTAGRFAWQQFFALNWPAKAGTRDTADDARKFGEAGPVVWETLRSKVEIYPGDGAKTQPHGYAKGAPDYGYDDPPQYNYSTILPNRPSGEIPPCAGQAPVARPAFANLDEISQVGFNHLYANGGDGAKLVYFLSKGNRDNYRYIAANQFWYSGTGSPYGNAAANFTAAVAANSFPPKTPYVKFPDGTVEVKAAFRPLTAAETASGRFYTTRVRYYEAGSKNQGCYREAVWGLLGMHIVQKTPSAQAFTWATFEQTDVIPTEDDDGAVVRQRPPNTPPLSYEDGKFVQGSLPIVRADAAYCTDPAIRLFYRELGTNTPSAGNICVEGRMHRIPPAIVEVNRDAHRSIAEYEAAEHLRPSPWHHYRLVNIQAFPFDKTQIVADPNSPHGEAAYYTSNIMIETDYTLQNNSGGPATKTGFAPSDLMANFAKYVQPPDSGVYHNVYQLKSDGSFVARYNMGGCTGCHGLTQVIAGSDYSYLLSGSSVKDPDFPETSAPTLATKYHRMLQR